MELHDLDKLFREKATTGEQPYAQQAEESGKNVWAALDIHTSAKKRYNWLGYAAVVLLLLGGGAWSYHTIVQRDAQISTLQKQLDEIAYTLARKDQQLEQQVQQLTSLASHAETYQTTIQTLKEQQQTTVRVQHSIDTVFIERNANNAQRLAEVAERDIYRAIAPVTPNLQEENKQSAILPEASDKIQFVLAGDGKEETAPRRHENVRFRIGRPQTHHISKESFALTFKF